MNPDRAGEIADNNRINDGKKTATGLECPDCGEQMTVRTFTLYDIDGNDIELDFPNCAHGCGHIAYITCHEMAS